MSIANFENTWLEPLLFFLENALQVESGRRGKSYWSSGRVIRLTLEDHNGIIAATVQGNAVKPYTVTLSQQRGVVVSTCTCPVGMYCKHGVAAALAVVDIGWRLETSWADELPILLPMFRRGMRGPSLPAVTQEVLTYVGGDSPPGEPVDSGGRAAQKTRGTTKQAARLTPWWEAYLASKNAEEARVALTRGVMARLVVSPHSWMVSDLVGRLTNADNPIETIQYFDQSVERFAQRMRLQTRPRDPALDEFLQTPEALELAARYDRQMAHDQLLRWLEGSAPNASAENWGRLDMVWLPVTESGRIARLHFQMLLTARKLRRSPRNPQAIVQLEKDVQSGKRQFSSDDTRMVRWVVRHNCYSALGYSYYSTSPDPARAATIPVYGALGWLSMWGDSGRISWPNGEALIYNPRPAHLRLSADAETPPVWAVAFPNNAEDRPVPLNALELLADHGNPGENEAEVVIFAMREGVLYRVENGGMPFQVFEGLLRVPEAPIARLRESRAGAILASRLFSSGSRTQEVSFVETVAARPIVECRLDDESNLSIVARAVAEDGTVFCWTRSATWERVNDTVTDDSKAALDELPSATDRATDGEPSTDTEARQASPHAIVVAPRLADVAPLEEWIRLVVPPHAAHKTTASGAPSRDWRMKGSETVEFLRGWTVRPPVVKYLGNKAFQSFVALRRPPRVTVRVEPSGVDWLQVSVEMEKDIESLTLNEVMSALQSSEDALITLSGGRNYRRDELEEYQRQLKTLNELGLDTGSETQRVHAMQLAGASADTLEEMDRSGGRLGELVTRAREIIASFKGVPAASVPKKTANHLRPYQRVGVDFLVWAAKTFGGALLADDMGLGKTLQVLAALTALRRLDKTHRPSLVVCPASVAHNWLREAERFAPSLRVVVIERGPERHAILERLNEYDLVVKNYALTRRDAHVLRDQEWLMVCVDEAQAIKNADADISRTVKTLSAQYRFALTGTPIENRLADLWSIMDFAAPGHLEALKRFEQRSKGPEAESAGVVLRARLRPVVLRRLKKDVAPELPPRIEERRDCEMTAPQRKAYLAEVHRTRVLLDGLKTKQVVGKERIQILAALTRLRQLCCDPALVNLPDKGSGKTDELMELLPPLLESGQKVLLFSQFVRMLKRLETPLHARGITTYMLTGETTKRQALVDRFEADPNPSVFLISLKAGGTGLNLVSASHVVLFDPWWNPAVEAQAIDRTHRIGQDKTVVAFRLVAMGTVEERILELQERKRNIVKDVLEEGTFNRSLTREDFEFILGGGA
ncbi:MAG: DEAD/DEAH box helicase [Candidatus Hydrogenedentes bacterium]|nr:DEAD/DEAH box helicase [Candidatus Hydrogenedentota bacterium]